MLVLVQNMLRHDGTGQDIIFLLRHLKQYFVLPVNIKLSCPVLDFFRHCLIKLPVVFCKGTAVHQYSVTLRLQPHIPLQM